MAKPVARRTDHCQCAEHSQPTTPLISGRTTVTVNRAALALQQDSRICKAPDSIIAGSASVTVNGRAIVPAFWTVSAHKASFVVGSPNVMVGGPIVVGDAAYWKKICLAMQISRAQSLGDIHAAYKARREGRTPEQKPVPRERRFVQTTQKNCGCEVVRQIIWGYGLGEPTEEEVLINAVENGRADTSAKSGTRRPEDIQTESDWKEVGGTGAGDREQIVKDWGGSSAPSMRPLERDSTAVVDALKTGSPVILPVNNEEGKHVILATAVEVDASGNPVAVYVNDSSSGGCCGERMELAELRTKIDYSSAHKPMAVGARRG